MSLVRTALVGSRRRFLLPLAQGLLSNVSYKLTQGGVTVYPTTPGTRLADSDGNQVYEWADTAALPAGEYQFVIPYSIQADPQSPVVDQVPLTGTLILTTPQAIPKSVDLIGTLTGPDGSLAPGGVYVSIGVVAHVKPLLHGVARTPYSYGGGALGSLPIIQVEVLAGSLPAPGTVLTPDVIEAEFSSVGSGSSGPPSVSEAGPLAYAPSPHPDAQPYHPLIPSGNGVVPPAGLQTGNDDAGLWRRTRTKTDGTFRLTMPTPSALAYSAGARYHEDLDVANGGRWQIWYYCLFPGGRIVPFQVDETQIDSTGSVNVTPLIAAMAMGT